MQEHETNDREEVDEDDGKDEGENDGPHVPCNGPDHILESLLVSDEVNQLKLENVTGTSYYFLLRPTRQSFDFHYN